MIATHPKNHVVIASDPRIGVRGRLRERGNLHHQATLPILGRLPRRLRLLAMTYSLIRFGIRELLQSELPRLGSISRAACLRDVPVRADAVERCPSHNPRWPTTQPGSPLSAASTAPLVTATSIATRPSSWCCTAHQRVGASPPSTGLRAAEIGNSCLFTRAVYFAPKTSRLRRGVVSESGGRRAGSEKKNRPPLFALRMHCDPKTYCPKGPVTRA